MALFGKKLGRGRDKDKEKENKEGENPEEEQAEEEKKPQSIPAETFSARAAGILGRMYRMILSVNLASNVCQVESGERSIFGKDVPVRLYFSDWCKMLTDNMAPYDVEKFEADFSAQSLMKALASDGASARGVFAMGTQEELEDFESTLHYWELRADAIPGGQPGTRCIIYIRELAARPAGPKVQALSEEDQARSDRWNDLRVTALSGSNSPLFFEYDVQNDAMYLHQGSAETAPQEIANYRNSLESRSDWTIFHSDLSAVRSALDSAIAGEMKTAEIRYRAGGGKGRSFHVHRMTISPDGTEIPANWVVGVLIDIDDQVKAENSKKEITGQMSRLIGDLYEQISEIDLDRDLIFRLQRTEDSFAKSDERRSLSGTFKEMIESGTIAPEYSGLLADIQKRGFLEKKTMGGPFETDIKLKKPGATDYTWYSMTITSIAGNRYMMFIRDISDVQAMREQNAEYAQNTKFADYNQSLLETVANLVEFRNIESGPHISHVRGITRILLNKVAELCPEYEVDKRYIDLYTEAAVLHDIGKIVVPDTLLNKEGKLTDEEFAVIKRHTTDGARIIEMLTLPGQDELKKCFMDVTLHHHEKYDGKGYPEGLVGDQNTIGAQAVSLSDVYDALVSKRSYKEGFSHTDAVRMILAGESGAFNPKLLECFKVCTSDIRSIYGDER